MAVIRENRVERVENDVVDRGDVEHTTRVVRNVGAERALAIARINDFVWLIAAVLEILLGLRFVLRLIAANPSSEFAQLVYNWSAIFVAPFQGLTSSPSFGGMVVEIPTLIAMVVYALVFWIITELIRVLLSGASSRSVTTVETERDRDIDT